MTTDSNSPVNPLVAGDRSREPESESPTRVYSSEQISVEWYAHRCIHSGCCVRALPRVFNPRRRPWIDVEAADSEEVARAVRGCPSGALQLALHDAPKAPDQPIRAPSAPRSE